MLQSFISKLSSSYTSMLTEGQLRRGEYLVQPGDRNTRLYLIKSGCVRVILPEEEEHTIRFGYKGSVISALDTYTTGQPTEYAIQALRKTDYHYMEKSAFDRLLDENPDLDKYWRAMLLHFVHQQMERERDLLCSSPRARYERVLERSPQLFQEAPLKYIASYLRMSPETLSRLRNS